MWQYNYNNELYHYGVKGMKWGVRRYQNADGTLTAKGEKKYSNMSNDKLQKTLYKQVKRSRANQTNWSNQWAVNNTIGPHSKASLEVYRQDLYKHRTSEAFKKARTKLSKLDRLAEEGLIDYKEYDKQYEAISKDVYRPELDRSVRYRNNGREYVSEYLKTYGSDMNIAYLRDLGYNESVAKTFNDRILKAKRKTLDGM